jgi:glycosyltransferase involved in cell wall biosynthesis
MKILVVSISAPPKNSPESLQTGKYIKHLAEHNEVTLITSKPVRGWAPAEKELERYLKGVSSVVNLATIPPRLITVIKKIFPSLLTPDDHVFFYWQHFRVNKIKPEIVFSRSTPYSSALMGKKLARRMNVPWVMHLSDIWADSPFNKTHASADNLERGCFASADIITLTSQKTVDFYKSKYPKLASKIRLLPNVYDLDDINPNEHKFQETLKFVFTGRLYGSRSIHLIIDALEKALAIPEVEASCRFVFAGFFDETSLSRIKSSSSSSITFLGHLNQTEALNLQRSADVLMVIDSLDADAIYDTFFPSKLLEYMAAQRRILAVTRGTSTTAEIVRQTGGDVFEKETLPQLVGYLKKCVEKFKERDHAFFFRKEAIDEYAAHVNAQRLEVIFAEALEKKK